MKDIFKAGVFRLLFLGFNFLVGLFIAVLAGSEVFGTISLMIINAALFLLVTGLGADQAIVWHGAGKKFHANKLFTFSFLTAFFQIFLFTLITFFYFQNTGKTLLSKSNSFQYFYLELIYFTGLVFLDKYVSLLYAQHKARICNLLLVVVTFVAVLILVACRYNFTTFEIDPFQFFCLLILTQALTVMILFHIKELVFFSLLNKQDIVSLFRFSGLVFITNIIQFLAYRFDYWLIDYFKTTDQVGIYSQANRFAGLLWIVPNIIAALLTPVITSPQSNFQENEVACIVRILNYLNLLITGLIIFISFLIYTYFLQQDYFDGFRPLLYMLPGFYFFTITILLAAYFSAKNLLWVNLAGSSICLGLIIIADFILIPGFGIKGAAWANTIAYTLSTIFTISMFMKISKMNLRDVFFLKKDDWKRISKLQS
jgi:O-antigen/teichoic acid export membrane protein